METKNFKISFIGLSSDDRTNKWSFTCKKCGGYFTPPTTILATQLVVCDSRRKSCDNEEFINYNELIDKNYGKGI